jgi:chromosome segregation ATPase
MVELQSSNRVADLSSQIEELEAVFTSTAEELERLKLNHSELRKNSLDQREVKSFLEQRVSELQSLVEGSLTEGSRLQETIEEKELVISALNQRFLRVSEDNADLANKMMQMKNDLIDAQVNYQTFDVVKVGRIVNSSAKVTTP